MPLLLAQSPDDAAYAMFILITIGYLVLMWLTVFVAQQDFKLIGAGLLTALAAMAYNCLVFPGGPLLAPQLMKLGFVLVLGGLVLKGLDRGPAPPSEDGHV